MRKKTWHCYWVFYVWQTLLWAFPAFSFFYSLFFFVASGWLMLVCQWLRLLYFSAYKFSFKLKSFTYSCHVTRSGGALGGMRAMRGGLSAAWVACWAEVMPRRRSRSWSRSSSESESLIYGLTLECNHIHLKKCITFGFRRCRLARLSPDLRLSSLLCWSFSSSCGSYSGSCRVLHCIANNFYCTWA